jgi:hypothetical protein
VRWRLAAIAIAFSGKSICPVGVKQAEQEGEQESKRVDAQAQTHTQTFTHERCHTHLGGSEQRALGAGLAQLTEIV